MEETDIITIGCEHLQRRNKLKGIAMQKLILETIKNRKEDISLKQILKLVSEKLPEYYIIESPFKIQDKVFNIKHEFVHYLEFPEQIEIYINEKIQDKKWKQCSECRQFILADKQKTKKCRKCRKGFFRFVTKKYENWTFDFKGSRTDVLNKLVNDGYLKQVDKLSKRADFFYYSDNIFYIYESKNKELSGLNFKDLYTSLFYPLVLKRCGYDVQELKLIFNGFWTDELEIQIQKGFAEKFDFKVKFYPIKKYLNDNGIKVKRIDIKKVDKKYCYDVIYGDSEQIEIVIYDTPINHTQAQTSSESLNKDLTATQQVASPKSAEQTSLK